MEKGVYRYFACANSCRGFVSLFDSVLKDKERVFILKGGPGCGKSTLMRGVGEYFLEQGEEVEYIHCSSDVSSIDGVVLANRKVAVVDGTAPHIIEPSAPGACEEYVNLGTAWNREKLVPYREEIRMLKAQISKEYQEMYQNLASAKKIHDRWEQIYLENLDFSKLNQAAENLLGLLFDTVPFAGEQTKAVHRFFGALTPDGSVNYIENLTEGLNTRYFIKGRPGCGKSTLMKKLATRGEELGQRVEVYHCSFDPDSVDMVLLRELGICVFDATPPHELFPSREGDVLVDLYGFAVHRSTDEENAEALSLIAGEYTREIKGARSHLSRVQHLHDALEEYYIHAVDFRKMEQTMEDLIREIE